MEIPTEVLEAYEKYAKIGGFSGQKFPYGTIRRNNGDIHFELKPDGTMALVGTERGRETYREETKSVDELMYWIFKDRAHSIAYRTPRQERDYEVLQQIALDEIGKFSPEWQDRLKREQDAMRR